MVFVFALVRMGAGSTVMAKILFLPSQLSALDFMETVMRAVITPVVLFFAINGRILPAPLAGNPIFGLLFVQLKAAPGKLLVKSIPPLTKSPLQYTLLVMESIRGVGLTVSNNESVVTQLPPAVKVKIYLAVMG